MTIAAFRIYYDSPDKGRELHLNRTHWGFAGWFRRRLKPIREQLRGPEVKGVDIVNLHLREGPARFPSEWRRAINVMSYDFACDLRPLLDRPPLENVAKLMGFASVVTALAPWPQVRALAPALAAPLTDEDRATLLPYLQWPRDLDKYM